MRQHVECAAWQRSVHSRYGLRGVRVGEASHPGPGSRFFALTEMDTDVEDEDHDGVIPEATPVEVHRRGARRLVIVGAQTQVDPVDPTVLDEDWDRSDTESIESRGGISDAVGEMEVEPLLEPPVPAVAVPVGNFLGFFQWLAEVDLEVVFKQRPCLMKSVSRILEGGIQVCHACCAC